MSNFESTEHCSIGLTWHRRLPRRCTFRIKYYFSTIDTCVIHQIHDHQLHSWFRRNIYGHCDNFTTGGPVLKDNKMLHSRNFICATGALDTLQSSHISAKGGILVFRPTTVTWFRCKAAIFPPKAAYGFLDPLCSIIQMYEQWLEQWLIAIRFSRAGKGRRLADKPGIDNPISDQSTASTSG